MKYDWKNIGFVIGSKFIKEAITFFTDFNYQPQVTYFYDKNKQLYIKLHSFIFNEMHYFASKIINGIYQFTEVTRSEVNYYETVYSTGYYYIVLMQNEIIQNQEIYNIMQNKRK